MTAERFRWDDDNEAHLLARHPDISPTDVDSVLADPRRQSAPNTGGRPGRLVIGKDRTGRLLVVVTLPTESAEEWYPKTAHPANSRWQQRLYLEEEDD